MLVEWGGRILRDLQAAFCLSQIAFMDENLRLQRLRRQRNAAGAFAVFLVLASFGLALPTRLARYRAMRAAQAELIDLQEQIVNIQFQIGAEQKQIIELQHQILAWQRK